jgi:hypothetical protein
MCTEEIDGLSLLAFTLTPQAKPSLKKNYTELPCLRLQKIQEPETILLKVFKRSLPQLKM